MSFNYSIELISLVEAIAASLADASSSEESLATVNIEEDTFWCLIGLLSSPLKKYYSFPSPWNASQ